MVGLLARGLVERAAQAVRSERLPLIQRLGADFAAVVDSHERGRMAALGFAQIGLRQFLARGRPCRRMHAEDRAQALVEFSDAAVDVDHEMHLRRTC